MIGMISRDILTGSLRIIIDHGYVIQAVEKINRRYDGVDIRISVYQVLLSSLK